MTPMSFKNMVRMLAAPAPKKLNNGGDDRVKAIVDKSIEEQKQANQELADKLNVNIEDMRDPETEQLKKEYEEKLKKD